MAWMAMERLLLRQIMLKTGEELREWAGFEARGSPGGRGGHGHDGDEAALAVNYRRPHQLVFKSG